MTFLLVLGIIAWAMGYWLNWRRPVGASDPDARLVAVPFWLNIIFAMPRRDGRLSIGGIMMQGMGILMVVGEFLCRPPIMAAQDMRAKVCYLIVVFVLGGVWSRIIAPRIAKDGP